VQQDVRPTVFVVDDDAEVRDSLQYLLKSAGMAVETYASGEEFLAQYRDGRRGCLILDIRMPGLDGLSLQEQLRSTQVPLPVIIITAYADVAAALKAMKTGAVDFLEKPFESERLLESIRLALQREAETRSQATHQQEAVERMQHLTSREREVCELIVAGCRSHEIGVKLGITEKTVEAHRSSVMQKTQCSSVAELVQLVVAAQT
jgi:two-component system, LuxR family, response regulator FixJ